MKLPIIALTLAVFLTSCSMIPTGDGGYTVPAYSKEQRVQAHKELTENNVPMVTEMMKDYKVLRDQVRVK